MHFSATVLKTYRRRLTNLSSRNRSLLLSSLPVDQFVDLHEADYRLNKPSFDLVVGLIARKNHVPLCAVSDPRDERTNALSKQLRRLSRTERFIEEERGTEDLHVGWPFVRGRFNDGTPVHGPLLFFPVHLTTEGNEWRLERRGDRPVQLNQSMGLAYSHFNGIKLADEWLDPDFEGFDKDPLTFRMQLYDWLKSSPYELNFNTKNFTNLLQPFDKQSAKSLTQLEGVGELTLMPEAVLGIFPQAGSFLVPDYDQLLASKEPLAVAEEETGLTDSFTRSLGEYPLGEPPLHPLRESSLLLPLPVDASQEAAVRAVKAGQSVVVQGPPGTGKSQLIANLMADAAAQGKRVLLVCQKRAALDVVHQRLKQVGMESFAALVHDFQDDRKPLYSQLAAQIDAIEGYRHQNNGLDAVLLEREFDMESRRIDTLVGELQTFKNALFDQSICGVSVKELYLNSNPHLPCPTLGDLYRSFRLDSVGAFREQLGSYIAYRERIGPEHPFASRVSFAAFTGQDLGGLRQTIDEAAKELPALLHRADTLFGQALSWMELTDQYAPKRAELDTLAQTVADPSVWAVLSRIAAGSLPEQAVSTFGADKTVLAEIEARGLLQTADTTGVADRLRQGITARQSLFNWLFYKDKPYLTALAQEHALSTSLTDLQELERRWVNRQSWEARANETGQQFIGTGIVGATPTLSKQALEALEVTVSRAETAWQTLRDQFPALQALVATEATGSAFGQRLMEVRFLLADVATRQTRWQSYLTATQLSTLASEPVGYAEALQTALGTDAENLMEMDRIWASFSAPERTVASRAAEMPGYEQPGQKVAAFDNALRLAWIDDIEQQHPELRSVSSLKMGQNEAALQHSIRQKQSLTHAILGLKLREQTYQALVVNRLNNLVSYRELRHQVTKKRSIWPIRKLMEHHADEVFRLVPCWMASPESVSTLFPMQEGLFDLVIFDEASQCFAENGLPAMLRGQKVVVTGDSKQLRPSDLYRARFDTDDPTTNTDSGHDTAADAVPGAAVMLEVESLLDLAAQYLPQVSLTGHYRSRSLDLIAFSNEHFYNNTLTLLPEFTEINNPEPGIRYLNVKGQWINNTNPVEAAAVLSLIEQLETDLPGRSIGVVTFNFQQQQLIQELLETPPIRRTAPSPPMISGEGGNAPLTSDAAVASPFLKGGVRFVKNIENVQGDECDVIIFSVGYAPDQRGRLSAQFGSLTMSGGENRLNVAVTRARERTYVITSVYPEQLSVEHTANEGPKLLKAYLQYALEVAQGQFTPKPRPVVGIQAGGLLKNTLSAKHPNWRPELPFADLTIRDGALYRGLVLTDDDQYFQQTPKEAHAYRPFALAARNWPFQRKWSREVWKEKEA